MIKNISIFPNGKIGLGENGKELPNYDLSINLGTPENPVRKYIGSGWKKSYVKDGETKGYMSVTLNNQFIKNDGTKIDGYLVITEEEYNHLKNCEERCKFLTSPQEDGTVIDMARHPLNSPDEQKHNDKILDEIGF